MVFYAVFGLLGRDPGKNQNGGDGSVFKNFRNNYYFGKAGQGDLTPEDMPTTRSQLFSVTLRTRLPQLIRLNVVYALIWIPTLIVLWLMPWSVSSSSVS